MAEVKDYSAEALMAKEHEVELDTDNVKEENVQVEEKSSKEETPNLNVGEVDLGYTGHEKPEEDKTEKPQIEVTEEKTETPVEEKVESESEKEKPNLNESRRDYQKRIDKLVFQKKEAERREKAALDFAEGIKKKFDSSVQKLNSTDEQYLKELDARVSIKIQHDLIDGSLFSNDFTFQFRSDDIVHIINSLQYAFTHVVRCVFITQFNGFMNTSRCTRRHSCTAHRTRRSDYIYLNSWIATRV